MRLLATNLRWGSPVFTVGKPGGVRTAQGGARRSAPLRLDWSEEAFLKFNFSKVLAKRPITSTCAKQADPKHLGDFSGLRGQGPGLVNVLWAERKTTSFKRIRHATHPRDR